MTNCTAIHPRLHALIGDIAADVPKTSHARSSAP